MIPGQALTLGGALTARLEWHWRNRFAGRPSDKTLAHELVRYTTDVVLDLFELDRMAQSPFERLLSLVDARLDG